MKKGFMLGVLVLCTSAAFASDFAATARKPEVSNPNMKETAGASAPKTQGNDLAGHLLLNNSERPSVKASGFQPSTTTCTGTSNGGACDGTDSCDGAGHCVDGYLTATTTCRPAGTACR